MEDERDKYMDNLAGAAAGDWCRCWKCDGIIRDSGCRCDKSKLETCNQWYHAYRAAKIALWQCLKDIEEGKIPFLTSNKQ